MHRLKQRSTKPEPAPFMIMVKPAGPACNYTCEYCYYLDKKDLFGRPARLCMNEQVLEPFIRDYFATAQEHPRTRGRFSLARGRTDLARLGLL